MTKIQYNEQSLIILPKTMNREEVPKLTLKGNKMSEGPKLSILALFYTFIPTAFILKKANTRSLAFQ